jgi:hypothetical protein
MTFHKVDKIARRVAGKCGTDEMGIAAKEVFGSDAAVGEIAPSAAGNADFFGEFCGVIEQQHTTSALPGSRSTHHAGCTGTNYNKVETLVSHNHARCVESGAEYAR